MRFFNTAGPCVPELHYLLPPEPRLPQARKLIDEGQYFVVHAPRQTGKTTTLATLARTLTAEGRYLAVRFSCEAGEVAGDDYAAADGTLVLFDRRPEAAPIAERTRFTEVRTPAGRRATDLRTRTAMRRATGRPCRAITISSPASTRSSTWPETCRGAIT